MLLLYISCFFPHYYFVRILLVPNGHLRLIIRGVTLAINIENTDKNVLPFDRVMSIVNCHNK